MLAAIPPRMARCCLIVTAALALLVTSPALAHSGVRDAVASRSAGLRKATCHHVARVRAVRACEAAARRDVRRRHRKVKPAPVPTTTPTTPPISAPPPPTPTPTPTPPPAPLPTPPTATPPPILEASLFVSPSGSDTAACTATAPCATFDRAYHRAAPGATVAVAAGSYPRQILTADASKAANGDPVDNVTFVGQGDVHVSSLSVYSASAITFRTMHADNGTDLKHARDIAFYGMGFHDQTYIEESRDVLFDHAAWEPRGGSASQPFDNSDGLDIYQQHGQPGSERITIQDSVFHGIRASGAAGHPDAIQFYDADEPTVHAIDVVIRRTRFYNNECINIRANDGDEITFENNVVGDSVTGISGCGYYSADLIAASAIVRYNTFTGNQSIQVNPNVMRHDQVWVGNVGVGMSTDCAFRGVAAYNVWTSQRCSASDRQVADRKLGADGSPLAGSPVIDAGDLSAYPADDIDGGARFRGAAPDAGAHES
jgi:hypothetical protein